MHTILGYKGAMGQAVLRVLKSRNFEYRLVSKSINPNIQFAVKANLLLREEADAAIRGSDFVYLCVGLPYNHKVWERDWEVILNNVINSCIKYAAKLIFLDNVYMYSHNLPVPFDENTIQAPKSKKGIVRQRMADIFVEAFTKRGLHGLIARSADFYGRGATNSVFYLSFLERIIDKKNPRLLFEGNKKHTFAYVDDNAKAMVELALLKSSYGQVWHLPVGLPITMNEILEIINGHLKTNYKISVIPDLLKKTLPYFVPSLKEPLEMQYQFEQEYVMSFDKFRTQFPTFETTPYEKGIKATVDYFSEKDRDTAPKNGYDDHATSSNGT